MRFLDSAFGSADAPEPRHWFVLFWRTRGWWPGRFQHVSAFTGIDRGWLHVSIERCGPNVAVRDDDWLAEVCAQCEVVSWPGGTSISAYFRPLTCAAHTAALIGAPSALSPDGFFRSVLAHGGTHVEDDETIR